MIFVVDVCFQAHQVRAPFIAYVKHAAALAPTLFTNAAATAASERVTASANQPLQSATSSYLHTVCARHPHPGNRQAQIFATTPAKVGRESDLRRLLLNYDYLLGKLAATDANALIADYDYLAGEKDLQLVQSPSGFRRMFWLASLCNWRGN